MFIPNKVLIEEKALHYANGKNIEKFFMERNIPITYIKNTRVKLEGNSLAEKYAYGKNILVVGVRKISSFQTCKPSAHYQLPLVSGCMGMCEYCYLNTQMGKRPYIRVYANMDEILEKANEYIEKRAPEITIFEGAATSDPLPLEPYTHMLEAAILHFAKTKYGRFRFVSKFNDIESLLSLKHNGHTEIRISLNINDVIKQYEHRTPPLEHRLLALKKLNDAGYPIGILIAPVFWSEKNKLQYQQLIDDIYKNLGKCNVTFEVISHRFTSAAKNNILAIFPDTVLPMNEEERMYKFGQFGYGKYIYPKDAMEEYKVFFASEIKKYFSEEQILYII